MSSLLKNLLIALVLAIIVWVGYMFFIKDSSSTEGTVVQNSTVASLDAQEFLNKLNELNAVHFDGTVFTDSRFNALIDFRQQLIPKPVGRSNPFAPTN